MVQIATAIPAIKGGTPVRDNFLDFSRPVISENQKKAVLDVLDSGWLTTGQQAYEFEREFSQYIGVKHSLAVNSCTAGLFLILKVLNIGPEDEVITSPNTFPATANVIEHLGAKPVFCDIRLHDGNINPELIANKITPATKAIIAVHFAGYPCDMDALDEISRHYNIHIISDSAHAIETTYHNLSVGSYGIASAYSFYATKNLTTGEGGMVVTNDEKLFKAMKTLRLHGLSDDAESRYTEKGKNGYDLLSPGYKLNMPDILAALGRMQLIEIEKHHEIRQSLHAHYMDLLEDMPFVKTLNVPENHIHAHHLFPVLLDLKALNCDKDYIMNALRAENIGVSQHFNPLHLYTYYRSKYNYSRGDFPVAEEFGDRVITLPFNQYISKRDVEDVVEALEKILYNFVN